MENSEDPWLQAIIRIEKNPFASEHAASFLNELVQKAKVMGSTDIVCISNLHPPFRLLTGSLQATSTPGLVAGCHPKLQKLNNLRET